MEGKRSLRPSPAMVVACLSLFGALGTSAYAVKVKLKANQVKTKNIRTGAVTGPKLAANAVTESKIADGSVGALKLGVGSVDAGKIAAGAVTKAKFAASGVATNTASVNLAGSACTVTTFNAPGVQPGDVIAFSVRDVPTAVGSRVVVQPAENQVTANTLNLQTCEVDGVGTGAVGVGQFQVDFVAIR
jgi:trimeric autotransporter adhesin